MWSLSFFPPSFSLSVKNFTSKANRQRRKDEAVYINLHIASLFFLVFLKPPFFYTLRLYLCFLKFWHQTFKLWIFFYCRCKLGFIRHCLLAMLAISIINKIELKLKKNSEKERKTIQVSTTNCCQC